MQCVWTITVPRGKFIRLEFSDFEVEYNCDSDNDCRCVDLLELWDGPEFNETKLERWKILFTFVTMVTVTWQGISIGVQTISFMCSFLQFVYTLNRPLTNTISEFSSISKRGLVHSFSYKNESSLRMTIETRFRMNGWAPGLSLKMRVKTTHEWHLCCQSSLWFNFTVFYENWSYKRINTHKYDFIKIPLPLSGFVTHSSPLWCQ